MQWFGRRESDNVEDNRGGGGGRFALGGGIVSIIALAIYYFTGIDASQLLNQVSSNSPVQTEQRAKDPNAPDFSVPELRSPPESFRVHSAIQAAER